MGHGAGAALLDRQSGLRAIKRLDLALLVDRQDDGMRRRIDIEAGNIAEFVGKLVIIRQLERADPMRRKLVGFENALRRAKADASRLGSMRPVQCVVSPGGVPIVRSTTRLTVSAGSGALPGFRVLSRSSPSTPSCMNRSCQRQTTGFDLPDCRITSRVPQPSAVARMTLARQTCGALRSEMIAASRQRSSGVTVTMIPVFMLAA
jgi:hypothetical protein